MRDIDFQYGEYLLAEKEETAREQYEKYTCREEEIKDYCDMMIQEGTSEAITKLFVMVSQHEIGKNVVAGTNWGSILRLALGILLKEDNDDKEKSLIFKVKNLNQLIYLFRTMRFLNYRWQFTGEEKYKQELETIFDEFQMSNIAREEILRASSIEKVTG